MYLDEMLDVINDAGDYYYNTFHGHWYTLTQYAPNTCTGAVMDAVRTCIDDIYYVFNNLFQLSGAPPAATWWYLHTQNVGQGDNNAEEYVLTMSKILTAMLNAEPHQPLLFIAYLEAYKASVWNATFDERFFSELVKKWLIWG